MKKDSIGKYKTGAYKKNVPKDKAEELALLWGEGSPKLTELLQYCIENDIKTNACCKGHPEEKDGGDMGYVLFEMPSSFAKYMSSYLLNQKGRPKVSGDIRRFGDHKPELALRNEKRDKIILKRALNGDKNCLELAQNRNENFFAMLKDGVESYVKGIEIDKNELLSEEENAWYQGIDYMYSKEGMGKSIELNSWNTEINLAEIPDKLWNVNEKKYTYGYSLVGRFCRSSKKGLEQIKSAGASLKQKIRSKFRVQDELEGERE